MNKYLSVAMVSVLVLLLSGCAGWPEYMNRSGTMNQNAFTGTQYRSTDYEILGPVQAEAKGVLILGLVTNGEDGVGLLWEEAMSKYGDEVTGLKDISSKTEYQGILTPIYSKKETTFYGIAVKE
ncbi:hypothetical protein ACMDCT_15450 [Halomonadaceae bacterium KBTZ08]